MSPKLILTLVIRVFGLYVIVANIPPIITLLLSGMWSLGAFVGMAAYVVIGYLALIRARDVADWLMRDLELES